VVSTLVSVPINDQISMLQWRDQSYFEEVYTNWSVEIAEAWVDVLFSFRLTLRSAHPSALHSAGFVPGLRPTLHSAHSFSQPLSPVSLSLHSHVCASPPPTNAGRCICRYITRCPSTCDPIVICGKLGQRQEYSSAAYPHEASATWRFQKNGAAQLASQ
jgi:hypothetical protein